MSERLRAVVRDWQTLVEFQEPFTELGNRGLEGLSIRPSEKPGWSSVIVCWEGGFPEEKDLPFLPGKTLPSQYQNPVVVKFKIDNFSQPLEAKSEAKKKGHIAVHQYDVIIPQEDGWAFRLTDLVWHCLLYTSPSPRDRQKSRMPSSA